MASASKVQPAAPAAFAGETASLQDFAGQPGLYLTQAQGGPLVAQGFASVDTTNTQGDAAFVTLTETGVAALNASNTNETVATIAQPVQSTFTVRTDIAPPVGIKRRGPNGGSKYPLDTMEVGQSFHVAKTAAVPDPAGTMASSIANSRVKFAVKVNNPDGSPKMITKTVRTYKSEGGKLVKDADGHRIIDTEKEVTVQETTLGRDWVVATVDASDPEGVGARVWRVV